MTLLTKRISSFTIGLVAAVLIVMSFGGAGTELPPIWLLGVWAMLAMPSIILGPKLLAFKTVLLLLVSISLMVFDQSWLWQAYLLTFIVPGLVWAGVTLLVKFFLEDL